MRIWRAIKRAVRAAVPPTFFLCLVAYFAYNSLHGERGLEAIAQRRQVLASIQAEQSRAESDRAAWEHKVLGLKGPVDIDPDLLDERARAIQNLADPSDIVVYLPPTPKK